MNVHDFAVKQMDGSDKALSDYKGSPLLIVNTASKCGFTPQFEGLEQLYNDYKDQGLVILGFPCNQFKSQDPGSDQEIADFCQINYGVTFPIFSKVDVKGSNADPLFKHLTGEAKGMITKDIKWNFTKFLVDRDGNVVDRFAPQTKPEQMKTDIDKVI